MVEKFLIQILNPITYVNANKSYCEEQILV